MKNIAIIYISLVAFILLFCGGIHAQTVELWGMVPNEGNNANDMGSIFKINSDGTGYTQMYGFEGTPGSYPNTLLAAANGKFYGICEWNNTLASNGSGVLFSYSPQTNAYDRLVTFNGTNGNYGFGSLGGGYLVQAPNGKIYGMTFGGGATGYGTIFQFDTATNVLTKLFDLDTVTGNGRANAAPCVATDGNIYFITGMYWSVENKGALLRLNPSNNTLQILMSLDPATVGYDGVGVTQASDGNLYGTTNAGGAHNLGTIYSYNLTTNAYSVLYNFTASDSLYRVCGSLYEASNGKLYAITSARILSYDISTNTFASIYNISPQGDPQAGFASEDGAGNLYATMRANGTVYANGTIATYNIHTNQYNIVYGFSQNQAMGYGPRCNLTRGADGKLYGTAYSSFGDGVIFSFDANTATYTKLLDMNYSLQGSNPGGDLIQGIDGKFYGIANYGGTYNVGTIFSFDPVSSVYTKIFDFDSINGIMENTRSTLLQSSNGLIYGMAQNGGLNGTQHPFGITDGVLFSINPYTHAFTKIYDFPDSSFNNGGGLVENTDGKIYIGKGPMFVLDTTTNTVTGGFVGLTQYTGTFSCPPMRTSSGKIYMMYQKGGINQCSYCTPIGTICSFNTTAKTYQKVHDFWEGVDGYAPKGSLVQWSNGVLYGMGSNGGTVNSGTNPGVIFQIDTITNNYYKLFTFDSSTGHVPTGSFYCASDNNLYATTSRGGGYNQGTIFKIDMVNNTFANIYHMPYSTGATFIEPANIHVTTATAIGCRADSLSITYKTGGRFYDGNMFTVQLSDSNGSFNAPVTLAQFSGVNTATANVFIPTVIPVGTSYRLRVNGSRPPVTGSNNGINILIAEPPVAAFSPVTTSISTGGQVSFTNQSTNNATVWNWSFTGGAPLTSALANPVVTYHTAGTYPVQLIATNQCGSDTLLLNPVVTVAACPLPVADFTPLSAQINTGQQVAFSDMSVGTVTSLQWTFTGGSPAVSTQANTTVNYNTAGVYSVQLVATNLCGSNTKTLNSAVTVSNCAAPVTGFLPASTTIQAGDHVDFTDQTTNAPLGWQWVFTGGVPAVSTGQNPSVTYNTVGVFDVQLTATNGCGSDTKTATASIHVNTAPLPAVVVNFPNGGEVWNFNSVNTVQATVTHGPLSVKYYASVDGGYTYPWQLYTDLSATAISSFLWTVLQQPSTHCKIKAIGFLNGVPISSDESDNEFTIYATDQPFYLNPNGLSHLYWPFENSNWDNSPTSATRNYWRRFGEENVGCNCTAYSTDCDYGCNYHRSGDFYAQDWNQFMPFGLDWQHPFNADCGKLVLSPLHGNVIVADYSCHKNACGPVSCTGDDANNVFIESIDPPNFIFGVLHFQDDAIVSNGLEVLPASPIGRIGATGSPGTAHAHCVLYKNTDKEYVHSTGLTPKEFLNGNNSYFPKAYDGLAYPARPADFDNDFAADFVFDAVPSVPPVQTPNLQHFFVIASHAATICSGDSILLTTPVTANHYLWSNGDTTAAISVHTPGTYSVYIVDSVGNGNVSQSFKVTLNSYHVQINSSNQNICGNEPVVLYPSLLTYSPTLGVAPDKFNHYRWSTGDTVNAISVLQPGSYNLTFTDGYGCQTSIDSIIVNAASAPAKPTITRNGNQLLAGNSVNCTYQWLVDGYEIPNATQGHYVVDSIGSSKYYSLQVTNAAGCQAYSDSVLLTDVEIIPGNGPSYLYVFPNPVMSQLTLVFGLAEETEVTISVNDVLGKVLKKLTGRVYAAGKHELTINTELLSAGSYWCRFNTPGQSRTLQFVVIK